MTSIEQGYIDIWIDEIVPCLKDTETGKIKEKAPQVQFRTGYGTGRTAG